MTSFDALLYKIWPYLLLWGHREQKNYIKSNKRLSLSAKHFYATDEHFQELSKTTRSARPSFFGYFFIITIRFSLKITNHRKKCHFHNINERQIARLCVLFYFLFLFFITIILHNNHVPFFCLFLSLRRKKTFLAIVFKTKS